MTTDPIYPKNEELLNHLVENMNSGIVKPSLHTPLSVEYKPLPNQLHIAFLRQGSTIIHSVFVQYDIMFEDSLMKIREDLFGKLINVWLEYGLLKPTHRIR